MTDALALLQALVALALVLALVWYGRRALTRGGLFARRGEHMEIEERLALDLRNALVVVRIRDQDGPRRLLLSTSDQGPARLLVELSPARERAAVSALPEPVPGEP